MSVSFEVVVVVVVSAFQQTPVILQRPGINVTNLYFIVADEEASQARRVVSG